MAMNKFILLLLLCTGLFGRVASITENIRELNRLTGTQKKVAKKVWELATPNNLQYTATAIAWQESKFGKWKINLADPSCGIFHKLLPEYAQEVGLKPTNWNISRLCEDLQNDNNSFKIFVSTFETKERSCRIHKYKNIWRCAVSRYNGSGASAREYLVNILNKIHALKIYKNKNKEK